MSPALPPRRACARRIAIAAVVLLAASQPSSSEEPVAGSFVAFGLPLPNPGGTGGIPVGESCSSGIEGIHKTSEPFTAPFDGLLDLTTQGFTGDWDLFLFSDTGVLLHNSIDYQIPDGAPPDEELTALLNAGDEVMMTACNFAGEIEVIVEYTFRPFAAASVGAAVVASDDGPSETSVFEPEDVTIHAGQAVVWENTGTRPHTVDADDGSFESGSFLAGTFARVFDTPGTYAYHCTFHGAPGVGQVGSITVLP